MALKVSRTEHSWGWATFSAAFAVGLVLLLTVACGGATDTGVTKPTPVSSPTGVGDQRVANTGAGKPAPNFSLTSADGKEVSLSGALQQRQGVVLVFYRGFF